MQSYLVVVGVGPGVGRVIAIVADRVRGGGVVFDVMFGSLGDPACLSGGLVVGVRHGRVAILSALVFGEGAVRVRFGLPGAISAPHPSVFVGVLVRAAMTSSRTTVGGVGGGGGLSWAWMRVVLARQWASMVAMRLAVMAAYALIWV